MKRLLHPHDHSSSSQQENNAAGPAPDIMGDTVERAPHPKIPRIPLRSFSLFWITLFITTLLLASGLVPQSPSLPQVTGNGGMSVGKPMCGTPLQVVHHFDITNPIGVPYTTLTIPTSVQLALLPRSAAGNPVSYNPQTSILCALNAVALQSAWLTINPIVASLPTATPTPSTTSGATPPSFQSGSDQSLVTRCTRCTWRRLEWPLSLGRSDHHVCRRLGNGNTRVSVGYSCGTHV